MLENIIETTNTDIFYSFSQKLIDKINSSQFVQKCNNQTITMPELRQFLIQHAMYSKYFTRYLCALISNLESSEDVILLASNLTEELGLTLSHTTPHSILYRNMLRDFNIHDNELIANESTVHLINTMFMLCKNTDYMNGLGALYLGAEFIVPSFYTSIINGFIGCGIDKSKLSFFQIHIECDDEHAETMKNIILDKVNNKVNLLTLINSGELAINSRLQFLNSITQ